jgi:hypothetical protein
MASKEELERELANDLQTLGDLIHDDSFYPELYKSLAGATWSRDGDHLTLSWKRAEELLNQVRARHGKPALRLAQTGGEGEVSPRVADALDPLGWTPGPTDTGRHDDAHVDSPPDAPPRGAAKRPEWERRAHAEADDQPFSG